MVTVPIQTIRIHSDLDVFTIAGFVTDVDLVGDDLLGAFFLWIVERDLVILDLVLGDEVLRWCRSVGASFVIALAFDLCILEHNDGVDRQLLRRLDFADRDVG